MARTDDWYTDLMKGHPHLFTDRPLFHSIGSGWLDVLERLCTRIENALQCNETFSFTRIKKVLGVALFDWSGEVSYETRLRIEEAIRLAEARAACTCETCGAKGHSQGFTLSPRCEEHQLRFPPVRADFEIIRTLRRRGRPETYDARYDRETDTLTEISPLAPPPEE